MSVSTFDSHSDASGAQKYNSLKRGVKVFDVVLVVILLFILLTTGWTRILRDWCLRTTGDYYLVQLPLFVFLVNIIITLVTAGLNFYSFRLEHRFRLSTQSFASWIGDEVKGWMIRFVVGASLAVVVYELMRISPASWWIEAWMIFTGLYIFFAKIAPVALFPLFYKFVPLQSEELKSRLMRLGARAGTKIHGVYEWKLSAKSNKANAAMAGLGNTRRILLADTLLRNHDDDEIEAVLAHELGHQVHGHIFKSVLLNAALLLVGFWVANLVLQHAIREWHMFQTLTDFANWPLLMLVSLVLSVVFEPIMNAYSRFNERQADLYCWTSLPSVKPFVTAMEKMNLQNLGERSPARLIEVLFYSHPAVSRRIAAAQSWAQKNRPNVASWALDRRDSAQ